MKKIFMFLAALMISGSCFAGPTPRATVQNFINAMKYGNAQLAVKEVLGGENADPDKSLGGMLLMAEMFKGARIADVESAGYGKSIVYLRVKNPMTDSWETIPMTVRKSNGEWKIELK